MDEKEKRKIYYEKNREKIRERGKIWRDANKEKLKKINKVSRQRWKLKTPIEKRQEINRQKSQKYRDTSGGKWKKYAAEYMKKYYAENPVNKVAHSIRIHAKAIFTWNIKSNLFPAPNKNQKVPYHIQSIKNILKVYSEAHEHNKLDPKTYCVNHIVSLPWLLKFFKVEKVDDLNVENWAVIWDICNLSVCEIKVNSKKRNYINQDVLATASILEKKHAVAKGLRDYLVNQI